jgi:hypothetical protein
MHIPLQRLRNQHLTRPRSGSPAALVSALGAVQAQEYAFAKWAVAQRLTGAWTNAEIDAAFDRGEILRTHILRPTWHFVASEDIGWMLELAAPRVHRQISNYARNFGLEKRTLTKAAALIERTIGDGGHATREDLGAAFARAGVAAAGTPFWLLLMFSELEGLICSGPRRGKHFTYALVCDRAPKPRPLDRDEALAELTRRFFSSHGPATIRDFVWWSGLTTVDAKRGLDAIKAKRIEQDGLTYWLAGAARTVLARADDVRLLPIYDEYLVAYRDRVAVPHGPSTMVPGPMKHAVIAGGHVVGTWATDRKTLVTVTPVRKLMAAEWKGVDREAQRFAKFLGVELIRRSDTLRFL